MKNLELTMHKIDLIEPQFYQMIDAHIAFFQEQDPHKQKLLHALYEYKAHLYEKAREEAWKIQ